MKHEPGRSVCRELWTAFNSELSSPDWSRTEELLGLYLDLLLEHAALRSLVADSQRNLEVLWNHVSDSLQSIRFVSPHRKILDIGSGGGLPGIPLAITCPRHTFVLVERSVKKAEFLELAAVRLALQNFSVVPSEITRQVLQSAGPDLIVVRAVAARKLLRLHKHTSAEWLFFATAKSAASLIADAEKLGLALKDSYTYRHEARSLEHRLLKFSAEFTH